jgi:hypothetical protein
MAFATNRAARAARAAPPPPVRTVAAAERQELRDRIDGVEYFRQRSAAIREALLDFSGLTAAEERIAQAKQALEASHALAGELLLSAVLGDTEPPEPTMSPSAARAVIADATAELESLEAARDKLRQELKASEAAIGIEQRLRDRAAQKAAGAILEPFAVPLMRRHEELRRQFWQSFGLLTVLSRLGALPHAPHSAPPDDQGELASLLAPALEALKLDADATLPDLRELTAYPEG